MVLDPDQMHQRGPRNGLCVQESQQVHPRISASASDNQNMS